MPIWATLTFLAFALLLIIIGEVQGLTWNSNPEIYILALACFLPCYVSGIIDIANRKLSFEWAFLFLLLPGIAPFIFYSIQSKN